MDFDYMGGSMGSVVGEKVTLIMEHALKEKLPPKLHELNIAALSYLRTHS